jgi:hypothetical protein
VSIVVLVLEVLMSWYLVLSISGVINLVLVLVLVVVLGVGLSVRS